MPFGIQDSSISKTGVKPHVVTGALVQIIRALFSDPENIVEDAMQRYIWNPDPKFSRILIESMYRYKTEDIQERPAVIVKRGPWKLDKLVIGDAHLGQLDETGFEEEDKLVAGAGYHTFMCLGQTGLEAELIGTEVYQHLLGFSSVIRNQICLGHFTVGEISEITKFEESHSHFLVRITASYRFFTNWQVLRQTPEWMRTSFSNEIFNG